MLYTGEFLTVVIADTTLYRYLYKLSADFRGSKFITEILSRPDIECQIWANTYKHAYKTGCFFLMSIIYTLIPTSFLKISKSQKS